MDRKDERFQEWRERARDVSLLEAAIRCGAVLKRSGAWHSGPCPYHGGNDRFSIGEAKGYWICRGDGGGNDSISLVMHAMGMSFLQACEFLTGEPPPHGRAMPLSEEERKRREERKIKAEIAAIERRREQAKAEKKRVWTAESIWSETKPLRNTLAEHYLVGRGIPVPPMGWPESLRFHPDLEYELDRSKRFPALVARIEDVSGSLCAVHAIYLDPKTAGKAPVDPCKVSIGPMSGGAVRLYGVGPRVAINEGVETGLAICWLINFKFPVFACLSTSGVAGLELPLIVERACCWPDSDRPIKRQNGVYVPLKKEEDAPGLRTMLAFQKKYTELGVRVTINQTVAGTESQDYLDWLRILNNNGLNDGPNQ